MTKYDCVVAGGGIIGMMTAIELAIQGASVAIFDRGDLGRESSWAAGGILSSMRPWAEHPASASLSEQGKAVYPQYVESLKSNTGIDAEYFCSGLMIVEENHVAQTKAWAKSVMVEFQEGRAISSDIQLPEKSVLFPDIAQVRPPRLIKALHERLRQLSISIYENTEITNVSIKNNQFSYVELNSGKVSAGSLIITAGAWSNSVIKELNPQFQIKPIHGEMLCVKPVEQRLNVMLLDGAHYLIPRLDGHVLIGSTMEDIGFTKKVTLDARNELLNWACSLWPELDSAVVVKHWSGLRPSTEGGKPIIGPMPGVENIYINSGHFRKGILQAPVSAKLLVDYLHGQSSFMPIEPFSIENQEKSLEFS